MKEGAPPLHLLNEAFASLAAYHPAPLPLREGGLTPLEPAPIKLDANESPWPLPDETATRLAQVLAGAALHRYPDAGSRGLKRALAARLHTSPESLVLGVGSDEVIGLLMRSVARAGAKVLFATPTFVMIPLTARVQGLTPVAVPLGEDFALDVGAMTEAIEREAPSLVYLATPNNPTGNAFDGAAVEAMVEATAGRAFIIIDEAYGAFATTTFEDLEAHPHVILLGTLSKIGLAGLRLGWGRMHPSLATEVNKARPPYNLTTYTQLAAEALVGELYPALEAQVRSIVGERARLVEALGLFEGARVFDTEANFVLLELPVDAGPVHVALREAGVQVRHFPKIPRLSRCLRITVGTSEENDALLEALERVWPARA